MSKNEINQLKRELLQFALKSGMRCLKLLAAKSTPTLPRSGGGLAKSSIHTMFIRT
jgi:hypothetical protein